MINKYPRPSFYALLNKFGDVELNCAEIGVCQGLNAVRMLGAASKAKFLLVDSYIEIPADKEIMLKNIAPYKDRARFIEGTSERVSSLFSAKEFDYIYIDAGHSFEEVGRDIELWGPKVKKGGILAGHDFNLPGVQEALTRLIEHNPYLYIWGVCALSAQGEKGCVPNIFAECLDWWLFNEAWDWQK